MCLRPYPQTPAGDGTEPLLGHSQEERIETQASNQQRGRQIEDYSRNLSRWLLPLSPKLSLSLLVNIQEET